MRKYCKPGYCILPCEIMKKGRELRRKEKTRMRRLKVDMSFNAGIWKLGIGEWNCNKIQLILVSGLNEEVGGGYTVSMEF